MQHQIKIDQLGPTGAPMTAAVEACVHCGFCLPTCPTYEVLGEEMDSPRGRIILMREVLEGNLDVAEAAPYLDRCLGCVGCETSCPSGVKYGELITPYRGLAEEKRRRKLGDRLLRWLLLATLPYPGRMRAALVSGRLARPFARLMPGRMSAMLRLVPEQLPPRDKLPELVPAEGSRRARVALLAGCAQQVLAPEINRATVRVLARNGVEVVIPAGQQCCGALAAHTGDLKRAGRMARSNLSVFPTDVDAVVTNAAGCGSGMKEYALWLAGTTEEAAARKLAEKVTDVSAFLTQLGPVAPGALSAPTRVAYHDACHLAHAQKVTSQPRELLRMIPNLELLEVPDGEVCCGSAGSYNIEQPEIAAQLGRNKARSIRSTQADVVATGNIGCITQIRLHLAASGQGLPVLHTMQLLDRAYDGASTAKRA